MKIFLKVTGVVFLLMILTYFLGPIHKFEKIDNQPLLLDIPLAKLDQYVSDKEDAFNSVKPKSRAHFIWQDSFKKTPYAVVYLHGFEASWGEFSPIVQNFSNKYGCNTYLARISQQGTSDVNSLATESPKSMIQSAKEAIAIGRLIGDTLIVMSTSTGSTYSIYLAANDPSIYAQIMTAPNIELFDPRSKLIVKPWGKQILKKLVGGEYHEWVAPEPAKPYWNQKYRIEGLIAVRDLINQTMTEDIWRLNQTPIFLGYYYKNEQEQDDVISVPAIHEFCTKVGTPDNQLTSIAYSNARGHVIGSEFMNENWKSVQDSIFVFTEEILNIKPLLEE